MNKYLLLRDNKQSGPYTVPEIIAMGIKPYDLVWLEGRSAAWRYPSEIEELKAHAPAVEEQPFDRFYKKPENKVSKPITTEAPSVPNKATTVEEIKTELITENHQRYQPKITVNDDENKPAKKVYINFPASNENYIARANTTTTKISNTTPASTNSSAQVVIPASSLPTKENAKSSDFYKPVEPEMHVEKNIVAERWQQMREPVMTKPRNNRTLMIAMTACALLGIISGILFFNYYRQRSALQQLSSVVERLESERKQQQASQAAFIREGDAITSAPVVDNAQTPQSVATIDTAVIVAAEKDAATRKTASANKKKKNLSEETSPVVFTENTSNENTGRPVERRDDVTTTTENKEAADKENLFRLVEVKPNEYKTGLLGGISNLKFELTNKSSVELQRVAIEVKYLGPEKKVVKKQTIYFENILPGAHSTLDVPKSNRGVAIEYTVTDIKS